MTNQGKNAIDVVLAESLKELAAAKPIERITIKEITDKAGVIRPTFYNHFQDKYELLEWIVRNELIDPIRPLLDNDMLLEGITFLFTSMEKNRDFYISAARMEGQNSFGQILHSCLKEEIRKHMDIDSTQEDAAFSWVTEELVVGFYANGMCYPILRWIKSEMAVPVSEMAEVCFRLLQSSLFDVIGQPPS